ncbi:E3 SUMO-protein ligase ZNF451 isoform X3 [Pseudoliparis swirei]|uniref:E3 SUMO-protein ligase ZNF451 isoform X3 n=1 Tax=Pseudoliparis swirei TaxID=2059687 RepID=UPI0024BE07FC|nr:E3 SUMO-protein ligase ZNF451 isoform X3 [Pseudoliparis swirei]
MYFCLKRFRHANTTALSRVRFSYPIFVFYLGSKPGVIRTGFGRRRIPASLPRNNSTRHSCPVINCGRVFENTPLLEGHLKRFDHSPCDPTINLKGCPSEFFACVACGHHFETEEAWRKHLESKVSSSAADGHSISQTYQWIVCFACPACYFLFNLRDECLQHMSAKNHFTESLSMNETRGRALPVPVSQYVKNHLITLCKDVTFNVRCSLCHKVLISHQVAQAHFNVHCRQGCAVAKAETTVVQVMKRMQVRGQCSLCCLIFHSQAEIEKHKESTQHDVEVNQTMAKALLQHCRFEQSRHTQRARETQRERQSTGRETPFQKRSQERDGEELSSKRKRLSVNGSASRNSVTAWVCECGLRFSEEATATNHLLAVNQIFHQCAVCGKHMGESSITRLHMSRFHGGAHLSNYLYYCRKCKLEMPRYEDILSHVTEAHSGHTYLTEQEVAEELAKVIDAEPSTSRAAAPRSSSKAAMQPSTLETSVRAKPTWMCRMCEDIFGSEADVREHCREVSNHSFQRFICGHCPQKFFKESTVRRHCVSEHSGQIESSYFCGLCDSMLFESEGEFVEHYKSLHSKDYYCMDDAEVVQPAVVESSGRLTCPCMGSEKRKVEMKATYTQCMRNLSAGGKCQYVCAHCDASVPSFAQMKTHIHTKHAASNSGKTFGVECKACQESFASVPSFHTHHHSRHCALEPCMSSRTCSGKEAANVPSMEISPDADGESVTFIYIYIHVCMQHLIWFCIVISDVEDETLEKCLNMDQTNKESEACENESDDEMNCEPSLSAEDERESTELDEALKRSLLEF